MIAAHIKNEHIIVHTRLILEKHTSYSLTAVVRGPSLSKIIFRKVVTDRSYPSAEGAVVWERSCIPSSNLVAHGLEDGVVQTSRGEAASLRFREIHYEDLLTQSIPWCGSN
jgi:hypothetical protein